MQTDDFVTALNKSEDLLWAAQPDELQDGLRILACQVAYARGHRACLPIDDVKEWLEAGRKDPTKRKIVTEGMERLIEVLTALGVESAKKTAI
ncbi:MAG: hypothetical protein LJE70_11860 [Chromatiaceae bacterium]|jgi:hypothetical protein|nr:hypothetical protein [Chromatiaceae bacterium]